MTKTCVDPTTFFGGADCRRMVQHCSFRVFPSSRWIALPKQKSSQLYYLFIAVVRRRDRFMPFPRAWTQSEMQLAYDNNCFAMFISSMSNVLNCNIIVSSNSSCAIRFTFRMISLGKVWTPLSSPPMGLVVPLLFFHKGSFGIK